MYGFKPRHAQGKPVQNFADGGIVHSLTGMLGMRKRTPEELRAADAKSQARNQEAATAAAGRAQAAPEPAAKAAPAKAERSRIAALGAQSTALLEGYKAGAAAVESSAQMHTKVWESQIRQYEASQNIVVQTAKINGDWAIQANNARMEAAKAGTQVYAQLTSSAYGMMHTSAGISGSASMSVGYSYGGDVSGAVAPLPAI